MLPRTGSYQISWMLDKPGSIPEGGCWRGQMCYTTRPAMLHSGLGGTTSKDTVFFFFFFFSSTPTVEGVPVVDDVVRSRNPRRRCHMTTMIPKSRADAAPIPARSPITVVSRYQRCPGRSTKTLGGDDPSDACSFALDVPLTM